MPILMKIGNLISCHSTNQFYQYLDDLDDFERKIRRGKRLHSVRGNPSENIDIQPTSLSETVSTEVEEPENNEGIADTVVVSRVSVDNEDTGMTSENRGRYSNIAFKEKLKTKGRQKKIKDGNIQQNIR